jgi:branched-chain amino acid transport system ATP-binding protein
MLRVEAATVKISGFTILRGVSLEVPSGEAVGLIGRNGAGKTTTLRTIMGLVELESGRIELDGRDLTHLPPHARADLGIGYMPEDRRLIPTLTVEENILVPAWARRLDAAERRLATVYDLLPEVKALRTRPATQLSGGQQKLVALARCFMSGSRLLLLDEPFEGVAPSLVQRLVRAVRELCAAERGVSALLCESEFKWPRLLASQIYLIERGETVLQEPAAA